MASPAARRSAVNVRERTSPDHAAPAARRPRRPTEHSIADLLREDRLVPFFQPVLSARQRAIVGVEALLRAELDDGTIGGAPWLFQQAIVEGRQAELERRAVEKAIERFACLPDRRLDHVLFLNLGSTLTTSEGGECFYVLDGSGIPVTDTVWNPALARRESSLIFRPAPKGTDHSLKEYYYVLLDVELQKYTTEPYVSFASGNLGRTISTYFRDASNNTLYILCIDVLVHESGGR